MTPRSPLLWPAPSAFTPGSGGGVAGSPDRPGGGGVAASPDGPGGPGSLANALALVRVALTLIANGTLVGPAPPPATLTGGLLAPRGTRRR